MLLLTTLRIGTALALCATALTASDGGHGTAPSQHVSADSSLRTSFPFNHGEAKPEGHIATNANSDAEKEGVEINASLAGSGDLISSSNLLVSAHDKKLSPRERTELLFKLARRQHAEGSLDRAAKNFAVILQSDAPDEMKRSSLIELAVIAQAQNQLEKAQQILSQYLRRYPEDPSVPEVYLRQGLLYRQMGAPALAQSKFHSVMTSALSLKNGDLEYYRRLVLHAQTEIADTDYLQGKYTEAAEYIARLLKLDSPELNKPRLHFKRVRCLSAMERHTEVVSEAGEFLTRHLGSAEEPEIRFLIASACKKLGRNQDALQQVMLLLEGQKSSATKQPDQWAYWQQRAGNDIANQLYQEGDYVSALQIYTVLAALDASPAWQFPVHYQTGLVYERLQQPRKATEFYRGIIAREKDLSSPPTAAMKTVLDMARWRAGFLDWQLQSERGGSPAVVTNAQLKLPSAPLVAGK